MKHPEKNTNIHFCLLPMAGERGRFLQSNFCLFVRVRVQIQPAAAVASLLPVAFKTCPGVHQVRPDSKLTQHRSTSKSKPETAQLRALLGGTAGRLPGIGVQELPAICFELFPTCVERGLNFNEPGEQRSDGKRELSPAKLRCACCFKPQFTTVTAAP